jgi:hypothetical protein
MSTTLQNRTVNSEVDQRIVLSNSEATRLPLIGSDWTKVRLGVRLSVGASANITGNPRIAIGLCTGVADGFGRTATTHFAGVRMSGASFNYTAGPPAYLTASAAGAMVCCKRISGTTTNGSAVSSAATMLSSSVSSRRSCLFVEITRGSPNFTFQLGAPTTAAAVQTDITLAKFRDQMSWPAWSVVGLSTWLSGYNTGSAITLAVDEATYGSLIVPNVYWDQTGAPLEVSDVQLTRLT